MEGKLTLRQILEVGWHDPIRTYHEFFLTIETPMCGLNAFEQVHLYPETRKRSHLTIWTVFEINTKTVLISTDII